MSRELTANPSSAGSVKFDMRLSDHTHDPSPVTALRGYFGELVAPDGSLEDAPHALPLVRVNVFEGVRPDEFVRIEPENPLGSFVKVRVGTLLVDKGQLGSGLIE